MTTKQLTRGSPDATAVEAETEIEITPAMLAAGRTSYAEEAGPDPTSREHLAGLKAAFVSMLLEWRLSRGK
jgi:hypothetical protein